MKGYQVFFIYVNKIEIESKSNETKEMKVFLDDFKNIFLEEINELPPIRDVDHAINLVDDGKHLYVCSCNLALQQAHAHHT